jgi:hypothetical protein
LHRIEAHFHSFQNNLLFTLCLRHALATRIHTMAECSTLTWLSPCWSLVHR